MGEGRLALFLKKSVLYKNEGLGWWVSNFKRDGFYAQQNEDPTVPTRDMNTVCRCCASFPHHIVVIASQSSPACSCYSQSWATPRILPGSCQRNLSVPTESLLLFYSQASTKQRLLILPNCVKVMWCKIQWEKARTEQTEILILPHTMEGLGAQGQKKRSWTEQIWRPNSAFPRTGQSLLGLVEVHR